MWCVTGEEGNMFPDPIFMTTTLTKTYLYSPFNLELPCAMFPPSNLSLELLLENIGLDWSNPDILPFDEVFNALTASWKKGSEASQSGILRLIIKCSATCQF